MEENLSLPETIAEPCIVCGTPTAILHFQLNVCRACAAFYRRSLDKHHSYKCQKLTGQCDVTIKQIGKVRCQYCRFQKCIKVGMKIGSENIFSAKTADNDSEEGLPLISSNADFAKLFEKTLKIFDEPNFSSKNRESCSNYAFSKLLENYIESRKPQKLLIHYLKNDPESYNKAQEKEFIKIAEFLNLYEPFSSLNVNDKYLLFEKFWEIFSVLEKFYQSCLYFGNNPKDLRVALWSYYLDYDELIRDAKDLLPSEPDKAFLIPMFHKARKIFKLFKSLNITVFELAYMSQIALWSCYDIFGISKTTQKIAEEMLEKASNEMHEYFMQRGRRISLKLYNILK